MHNNLTVSTGCENDWKNYQNKCIKLFHTEKLDHRTAEQECIKYDGHLVTIETKNKMEFVHHLAISLVASQPILKFYIGKSIKHQSKKIKRVNKKPYIEEEHKQYNGKKEEVKRTKKKEVKRTNYYTENNRLNSMNQTK